MRSVGEELGGRMRMLVELTEIMDQIVDLIRPRSSGLELPIAADEL